MNDLYNKIDAYLLKKFPFQWIIAWHKFIPLLLVLAILGIGLGFLPSLKTYSYYNDGNIELAATFLGFVATLVFILYIIRQLRFNSFRIHHHIPFKRSNFIFFAFWFISLLFTLIPFIPFKTLSCRAKNYINHITNDFEADQKAFYDGSVFFAADPISNGEHESLNTMTVSKSEAPISRINNNLPRNKFDVVFKKDSVSINRIDNHFGYYDYTIRLPITISKAAALQRIADFVSVSKKYDIQLTETNPEVIFNKRKAFNEKNQEDNDAFSLLIKPTNSYNTYDTAINQYSSMVNNYERMQNTSIDLEFFLGLLLFSAVVASLLWILISVPSGDFGYAILASVLIAIFMGILSVLVATTTHGSDEESVFALFYILTIFIYSIAFSGNKTRLQRIFKIVSHFATPLVFILIYTTLIALDIFDDYSSDTNFYIFIAFTLIGTITSTFIYKQVYKKMSLFPS